MAEGDGLLNRYRGSTSIVGSNPIPSAISSTYEAYPQRLYNGFPASVPTLVPPFRFRITKAGFVTPRSGVVGPFSRLLRTFRRRIASPSAIGKAPNSVGPRV